MNIEFRTDELNAHEFYLLQQIEKTNDVCSVIDFIVKRAVTPPDPAAIIQQPMSIVYLLFHSAACLAVKSTTEACGLPSSEQDQNASKPEGIGEDDDVLNAEQIV